MKPTTILKATLESHGPEGGTLYLEAEESCHVHSYLMDPYSVLMSPFYSAQGCWIMSVAPTPNGSQIINILQDGKRLGFISFRWTPEGPRPIHITNIDLKYSLSESSD